MTLLKGRRPRTNRMEIELLIGSRLRAIERQRVGAALMPKSTRELVQEILEDVLDRANGHLDRPSLISLIDICIREDEIHERIYQERALKSFFGFRARVLRTLRAFLAPYLNLRPWRKKHRK